MRKLALTFCLLTTFLLSTWSIEISRMEPAFWWVGMNNPELQILVHGKDIANAQVKFNYPGVTLKEVVRLENPNYVFVYLNISKDAQPGTMEFTFSDGKKSLKKSVELKSRATTKGAQGFDSSDVMYLIMPDRFANGDPNNDNWENVKVDRNDPNARHGGDIKGIINHLDYVSDLGVTTLWFNPILENKMPAGSYHGYAITDFYKVDQRFGTNEDYCQLIEKIHGKGMKVVMDMIYNHCGSSHWWMNDFPASNWLNNQQGFVQTTHNSWTVVDIHAPQTEIDAYVDGWFVPEMPDMNQRNNHLATYLIQNSIWWIEYARIDGIRHDTHPYADKNFLSSWCKAIMDEYPDFNIVGEAWYHKEGPIAWWQRNSKVSGEQSNLKTTMDFNLVNACNDAWNSNAEKFSLFPVFESLAQDFLHADINNILVFLDNHDTSRFFKANESDLNKYKQAIAFILTTRGIPQLYYGTEILMFGEKSEGDGLLRKDFPGGWQGDGVNAFTKAGRTDVQNEAWDYMQNILKWRKNNKAITEGKLVHYTPDNSDCYVYARIKDDKRVLVLLNGSDKDQTLSMNRFREVVGNYTSGKDINTGKIVSIKGELIIPAKGSYILELQ